MRPAKIGGIMAHVRPHTPPQPRRPTSDLAGLLRWTCASARSRCARAIQADTEPWGWSCGFYPGSHPREHQSGTAATFDQAGADFEAAWREFLSTRTERRRRAVRLMAAKGWRRLTYGFFRQRPIVGVVPHFAPSGAPPPGQNTETNVSPASQSTAPSACTDRMAVPAGPGTPCKPCAP